MIGDRLPYHKRQLIQVSTDITKLFFLILRLVGRSKKHNQASISFMLPVPFLFVMGHYQWANFDGQVKKIKRHIWKLFYKQIGENPILRDYDEKWDYSVSHQHHFDLVHLALLI